MRRLRYAWLLALASWATLGCGTEEEHPTQVIAVFDADDALRPRVARVAVEVFDSEGASVGDAELTTTDPGADLPWFGLRLVPRADDASRRFSFVAEAFDDAGDSLGVQTVEGGYVEGEVREIWIVFDDACVDEACPDGFRCQEARCVERCVEPTPPDGVTRSRPFACGDPCSGPVCTGELIAQCEDGALVVERACLLGCADASACQEIVASNLDRVVGAPPPELGDLHVPDRYCYFDTGGEINVNGGGQLRAAGDLADGIRFEPVDVDGQPYYVVSLRNLTIDAGGVLALGLDRPFIFLVHGEAMIDGRLQAGPAGQRRGGLDDGMGPGAGTAGTAGMTSLGGGGGASYGSIGGAGGAGDADAPGGLPSTTYGTPELVPLLAGSSGGGGAGGAEGGDSGGAVQVTARTRIVLGPDSDVQARGGRGETVGGAAGGGGGSGGGVLLEAPVVILSPGPDRRVQAAGGAGGAGRDAMGAEVERGQPSSSTNPAEDGRDGAMASGGGGGAGRVRINNANASGLSDYEGEVSPTGASVFTVGEVGRAPPE